MVYTDRALHLLIRSLQFWGLFPEPFKALCPASSCYRTSSHRSQSSIDKPPEPETTKLKRLLAAFSIAYSAVLVVFAWLNAFRYLTLYMLAPVSLVTDFTYITAICMYYFVGATLRTSVVLSCWIGGNKWRRLIDRIGSSDVALGTAFVHLNESLTSNSNNKPGLSDYVLQKLADVAKNRENKATNKTRVWLLSYTVTSWAVLALGTTSMATLMTLYRSQFGLFGTPFHSLMINEFRGADKNSTFWGDQAPVSEWEYYWPVVTAFCGTLLQLVNDSAVLFVTTLISCLTIIQATHFKELRKIACLLCPATAVQDINTQATILSGFNRDFDDGTVEALSNSLLQLPASETEDTETDSLSNETPGTKVKAATRAGRQPVKQFDLILIRRLHLRLRQAVHQTDRLARVIICVSMVYGFFGTLILSHHIILGGTTLFGRLTWTVWILVSFNLLFVHVVSSAYLNHTASTLIGALHRFSAKKLPNDAAGVAEFMLLLNQISVEPVCLTLLALLPLRTTTVVALAGALCTYFIILLDYSTAELHKTTQDDSSRESNTFDKEAVMKINKLIREIDLLRVEIYRQNRGRK